LHGGNCSLLVSPSSGGAVRQTNERLLVACGGWWRWQGLGSDAFVCSRSLGRSWWRMTPLMQRWGEGGCKSLAPMAGQRRSEYRVNFSEIKNQNISDFFKPFKPAPRWWRLRKCLRFGTCTARIFALPDTQKGSPPFCIWSGRSLIPRYDRSRGGIAPMERSRLEAARAMLALGCLFAFITP
jgi:hypothetical protein